MSAPLENESCLLEPEDAPGRARFAVEERSGSDAVSGNNGFLSWAARSDVGLVRGHNEDSFLAMAPLFVVSDGMGGHAAGEVASSIAIETIGNKAPAGADDVLLGVAVEAANLAVIQGAEEGAGKPGMGCTATSIVIEGSHMSVAHVGDSRVYLLHHGILVRVTHDHSYVEELVDCGQITADEARNHPSRSVITRALGSDPDMYADHFTLEVNDGDRIIVCSDGLSGMVSDNELESIAVSSATPMQATNNLVSAALTAGGLDNVTVIVVDVLNDGLADAARKRLVKRARNVFGFIAATLVVALVLFVMFIKSEWFLGIDGESVAVYQGVNAEVLGIPLYNRVSTSGVYTADLPISVQEQLFVGIPVSGEKAAQETLDSYRDQIEQQKNRAVEVGSDARSSGVPTGQPVNPEVAPAPEAPASTNNSSTAHTN